MDKLMGKKTCDGICAAGNPCGMGSGHGYPVCVCNTSGCICRDQR